MSCKSLDLETAIANTKAAKQLNPDIFSPVGDLPVIGLET